MLIYILTILKICRSLTEQAGTENKILSNMDMYQQSYCEDMNWKNIFYAFEMASSVIVHCSINDNQHLVRYFNDPDNKSLIMNIIKLALDNKWTVVDSLHSYSEFYRTNFLDPEIPIKTPRLQDYLSELLVDIPNKRIYDYMKKLAKNYRKDIIRNSPTESCLIVDRYYSEFFSLYGLVMKYFLISMHFFEEEDNAKKIYTLLDPAVPVIIHKILEYNRYMGHEHNAEKQIMAYHIFKIVAENR
jgi:hypothetical protein